MSTHLAPASFEHTVTLPVVTIGDRDEHPRCLCGERLVLSQPNEADPERLLGVCPEGCEWTVVEVVTG